MTLKVNKLIAALIILALFLVVGGTAYFAARKYDPNTGESPSGTWSAEESFPGAPVSDFKVAVENLKKATHYELYVGGVQIGERVTLEESVRSLGLLFMEPELMELLFFDSENAVRPLARVRCCQLGELLFSEAEGGPARNSDNPEPEESENYKPAVAGGKGEKDNRGGGEGKKDVNEKEQGGNTPEDEKGVGDKGNAGKPRENVPEGEAAGRWSVEPDLAPISKFTVAIENVYGAAYYELSVAGSMIGNRTSLEQDIRSINLIFGEPDLLEVSFFENGTATDSLAKAACCADGSLQFIK